MILNRSQRIGMRLFAGGIGGYLAAALLIPSVRWLWLAFLGMSAIGCVCYAVGTIPGLLAWLKTIGRE
jgi:hypothetical protein